MPKEQYAETHRPRRVALESHHTGITLTYRWFTWFSIIAEIFFIFWSVVWIRSFSRWLQENLLSAGLMERLGVWLLIEGLFLLFGAALGIWAIYGNIAHIVNRTVITVTGSEMSVREGPALYRENITIPTPEVSRIHIEEVVREDEGKRIAKYRLSAVLKDDQRLALISDSDIRLDEARFLAQRIAKRLGVEIDFDSRR
jgi:hypothetical protein